MLQAQALQNKLNGVIAAPPANVSTSASASSTSTDVAVTYCQLHDQQQLTTAQHSASPGLYTKDASSNQPTVNKISCLAVT